MVERSTRWQLRDRVLRFGNLPMLMGIINVTPDSFSDGGRYHEASRAVERGLKLVEEGAEILDVGGESTRPYSTPVQLREELRRVVDVVAELARRTSVPISIDTSKADVARQAIDAGAQIINDVTGLEGDPHMPRVALESRAGVCAMHMQGTPQTMQDDPRYADVVMDIFEYLRARRDSLLDVGIDAERICLDPGIGFGKTHEHNLRLLAQCRRYHELGCPILIGHSRKGFIAKRIGDKQADRTAGSVGVALAMARRGIQILRVHDVQATRHALLLFEASGGLDETMP